MPALWANGQVFLCLRDLILCDPVPILDGEFLGGS